MARGVNKVILIGNLGNDPEVRYTPSGSAVANIVLATSTSWRDKQTGELNERTEWHRLACFNRLAEIVGEYLHKGSKIYVEGSLRTRKWQDKNGIDRYTTEIIVNELHMLDSRQSGGGNNNSQQGGYTPQSYSSDNASHSAGSNNATSNVAASTGPGEADLSFSDDDIPF